MSEPQPVGPVPDPTQEFTPEAVLNGGDGNVYVRPSLGTTGCCVVEPKINMGDQGDVTDVVWTPCGLPPFAYTYQGWYDKEREVDVYSVLCYRHLHALGDTKDMVVRPGTPPAPSE